MLVALVVLRGLGEGVEAKVVFKIHLCRSPGNPSRDKQCSPKEIMATGIHMVFGKATGIHMTFAKATGIHIVFGKA